MPTMHRIESYESTTSAMSGVSSSSSELLQIQESKSLFETAETIEQLQEFTISFLRGNLLATAYHYGPLLTESQPLVEKLIQLNQLGFITTGSQPGSIDSYGIEKRFYVEGILKRSQLTLFLQSMYVHCGAYCFISILDREHTYDEIHNLKILDQYYVTRTSRQGILHISEVNGPCQMFQTCDNVYPQLVDEYISIFVMDTRWKNTTTEILDAMLTTLKEIQDIPTRIAQKNKYL